MNKPDGYWVCGTCGRITEGNNLYQLPHQAIEIWTCSDLFCGGICNKIDIKKISSWLNKLEYKVNHNIFYSYEKALRLAAEEKYKSEIVDTGMEDMTIGEFMDFYDKEDWIQYQMNEWLEESKL